MEEARKRMEFIPGEPERRPVKVTACAERTIAVREAEREVQLHLLVGVRLDARVRLTCEQVRRDVLQQLRIPDHLMNVTKLKDATFLLRFEHPELRNAALGRGLLSAGRTRLHLMPWTRQCGAVSASKLLYRVRVCIEGIPAHAASVETASKLFQAPTFVESIDLEISTEDERACLCVWIWTADPDCIALQGLLSLEEPFEFTDEQHNEFSARSGNMELLEVRNGPAGLLDYEIFLHVDRVMDYTLPTTSSSSKSYGWPVRHSFHWQLGVPDRARSPRRVPVQQRLGERRRDRSLPGGGAGGHSRMQMPPATWRDITRLGGNGNVAGGNQGHGDTYRGRNHAVCSTPVTADTGVVEENSNLAGDIGAQGKVA